MTNVKLKLMFYLLNALLTDIIHAKPYSDTNHTDIVIKISDTNDTFIPVESNSDTLIVANDDQTPEETNKNANTQMEAILNAEQNRDEAFSKKVIKDQKSVLEMTKTDAAAIEQQLNTSSSLLEDIIDSETDREETLTDILFRPDAEFVEGAPRFEFLIAAKLNESEVYNKTGKRDGANDNSLDILARNVSDVMRKSDYVELVEVMKPGENKSAYTVLNMTSHEVDNDLAPDTRFSDTQTLFLACFATLLPLLTVLVGFFVIRCMCRRWCPLCWSRSCAKESESSLSDSSEKQDINERLKSPLKETTAVNESPGSDAVPANGSIFTMTLKNNHLIVETEERNDFTKNGRETKMKYSPDSDGIFVVEVQQSNAYRPNNIALQHSPPQDSQISTNQALIHRIDEELEKKIIEEESEINSEEFKRNRSLALSSTGLSISDLSMSSVGSQNVSYSYTGQLGYELGPFGYPVYAGYEISNEDVGNSIIHDNSQEPLILKTPIDSDRPVVTSAIFKQDSVIGNDTAPGPGYCMEGSSDGPLLSDVQAREFRLQHLHDDDKKIENGVAVLISEKIESPKKTLNRADSLPVRLEEEITPLPMENLMETIAEDEVPKEIYLKGKRASLPIIRTEMYESVKDVMRPVGSPKFEIFDNEVSPEGCEVPPLITIAEEHEPTKSESTS